MPLTPTNARVVPRPTPTPAEVGDTERPPSVDLGRRARPRPTPVPPLVQRGLESPTAPMAMVPTSAVVRHARVSAPPPSSTRLSTPTPALTRACPLCQERYPTDFVVCPRDASTLVAVDGEPDPLLGRQLGESYRVVRFVADGGMGRIYEARHVRLKERRFAVKVLHADMARSPETVARFLREAELASSFSHPNVVDVLDANHLPDGTPYLVAEYLEGLELAAHVERHGPLTPAAAIEVGAQLCRALEAAHARGIVHRDMKPENVIVVAGGPARQTTASLWVKILDFGISKADDRHTKITRMNVIMGTPSYMAPEQARGSEVDLRADVYAAGAVLYFALTGKRPFDADDPTTTLSMVLTQDPMRLRTLDPRIPEGLELVVQRAMAKEASERYATMAEFEAALASLETAKAPGIPTSTPPTDARPARIARALLGLGHREADPALAEVSRPVIVVLSVALAAWLAASSAAALGGVVRLLHEADLTITEALLVGLGCGFAAFTPAILYAMHLRRVVWPNSVKAVQLALDLRRAVLGGLVAYGSIALFGRASHSLLARNAGGVASGAWDIALFVVSLVVAVVAGGAGPLLRMASGRRGSTG